MKERILKFSATAIRKLYGIAIFLMAFGTGAVCCKAVSDWTMIRNTKHEITDTSLAVDDEGDLLIIDRRTGTYMLLDEVCGLKVAEMYNVRTIKQDR